MRTDDMITIMRAVFEVIPTIKWTGADCRTLRQFGRRKAAKLPQARVILKGWWARLKARLKPLHRLTWLISNPAAFKAAEEAREREEMREIVDILARVYGMKVPRDLAAVRRNLRQK